MKRYEKPRLVKRGVLPAVAAQSGPSDLASPPPLPPNSDGGDEGGSIV